MFLQVWELKSIYIEEGGGWSPKKGIRSLKLAVSIKCDGYTSITCG